MQRGRRTCALRPRRGPLGSKASSRSRSSAARRDRRSS